MKKVFIGIIVLIVCVFISVWIIKEIQKYRFGYFVEGPNNGNSHNNCVLKLDNNNILYVKPNRLVEIYNSHNNKLLKTIDIPNKIKYQPKAILLQNNKLLLTAAYLENINTQFVDTIPNKKPDNRFKFDSMIVLNLDNGEIENIIQKKINQEYPFLSSDSFTLLNNGKVLIIGGINGEFVEDYNPKTNMSKLLNLKTSKISNNSIIPYATNQAFIFGTSVSNKAIRKNSKLINTDTVLVYDDKTETIKPAGITFSRIGPIVKQINENEILIIGGKLTECIKETKKLGKMQTTRCSPLQVDEIEIYNTNTHDSKIVANLLNQRKYEINANTTSFSVEFIDDNHRYLLITGGWKGDVAFRHPLNTSEILDLKKYKIFNGPNTKYAHYFHKMFHIGNGKVMIMDGKPELFKRADRSNNE